METPIPSETYKCDLTLLHDLTILHGLHAQFVLLGREGPAHAQTFQMELRVGDLVAFGSGPSKQKAKLSAAKKAVQELKKLPVPKDVTPYWSKAHVAIVDPVERPYFFYRKHPVNALTEILIMRRQRPAEFKVVWFKRIDFNSTLHCVEVTVGQMSCRAQAPKKSEAKAMAAERMLEMMGFKEQMEKDNPPLGPLEEQLFAQHVLEQQEMQKLRVRQEFKAILRQAHKSRAEAQNVQTNLCEATCVSQDSAEVPQTPTLAQPLPAQDESSSAKPGAPAEEGPGPQTPEQATEQQPDLSCPVPVSPVPVKAPTPEQDLSSSIEISSPAPKEKDCPLNMSSWTEEVPLEEKPVLPEEVHREGACSPEQAFSMEGPSSSVEMVPLNPHSTIGSESVILSDDSCVFHRALEPLSAPHSEPSQDNSSSLESVLVEDPAPAKSLKEGSVETESSTSSEQTVAPGCTGGAIHTMVAAMLTKMFEKAHKPLDTEQQASLVLRLQEVERCLRISENSELKAKELKAMGKAAAKSFLQEFGSASTFFQQSDQDFIKATIKHLSLQLHSFRTHPNRAGPLSGVKLFRRNIIRPGPLRTFLSSGPQV